MIQHKPQRIILLKCHPIQYASLEHVHSHATHAKNIIQINQEWKFVITTMWAWMGQNITKHQKWIQFYKWLNG